MQEQQLQILKQISMAFYLPDNLRGLAWNLQNRFDQRRYDWLIKEVTSLAAGVSSQRLACRRH
jgi:hypothetical protein